MMDALYRLGALAGLTVAMVAFLLKMFVRPEMGDPMMDMIAQFMSMVILGSLAAFLAALIYILGAMI